MMDVLKISRDALEQARLYIEGDEETHGRQFGDGNAIRSALAKIDAALSTLPVNDRHHSVSLAEIPRNPEGVRQTSDDVGIDTIVERAIAHAQRYRVSDGDPRQRYTQAQIEIAIRAALKGVPQPASDEPDDFDDFDLEPGELRPCPFCGGEAERIDFDEDDDEPENIGGSAITCKRCQCSTAVVFGYKETLFSSWNERVPVKAQPASEAGKLSSAANDVLAERERQKNVEGWTPEHDDTHANFEMARAAAFYALHTAATALPEPSPETPSNRYGLFLTADRAWPPEWDHVTWKKPKSGRRNLVRAGALILAEIERLDRAEAGKLSTDEVAE